jgi:serine phosphatase RsbU (regulator of sigma subunit)
MLHQKLLEKERIEEQLRIARLVQERLLPAEPPTVRGYDNAGVCIPTFEIGGDYFDWIPMADGRLGLVVADVAGKGVPAALIMAVFRALVRIHARSGAPLGAMMQSINRHLRETTGQRSFVTAFYGVLDPPSGRVEYANCGHSFPLLLRRDGSLVLLETGGSLLGPFTEATFEPAVAILDPGDMLVMYTDGVVDAENADGEAFEVKRLETLVRAAADLPARRIIEKIREEAELFRGREQLDDDFTLVILKRKDV